MANLSATPGWDNVPQLDTTTPALGGAGGPMNYQAQALLNRTALIDEKLTTWINVMDYIPRTEHAAIYAGTSTYDASANLQAAANAAISANKGLRSPPARKLFLNAAVDLRNIRQIDMAAEIVVNPSIVGVPVTVGGFSAGALADMRFMSVTDGTSVVSAAPPSRPVFRVFGLKSSTLRMGNCNYLQFWADSSVAAGNSNAYNKVYLTGVTTKLELTDTGSGGWNNENVFYGGRLTRLYITGVGYTHNHNKFYEPDFEGTNVDIRFTKTWTNQIYGARFEGVSASTGVQFAADTYGNSIYSTWSGSGSPRNQFSIPTMPISDLGAANVVTTEYANNFTKTRLFGIGGSTPIIANSTASASQMSNTAPAGITPFVTKAVLTPSFTGFSSGGSRLIACSQVIPVKLGDVVTYELDYDGSAGRTVVWVFDSNMRPLLDEGAGGVYWSQAGTTFNTTNGYYAHSVDQPAPITPGAVARSEVAFIRVAFYSSATNFYRFVGASIHTQSLGRGATSGPAQDTPMVPILAGAPTMGVAPLGYRLWDSTNKRETWCSYRWETRASGALATGATSITIAAAGSIANGDICGIALDNGQTHWTTVSGLSGSTHTIDGVPTSRTVLDTARVSYIRWEHSALVGSATYDPASLADGAGATTTVTVTGAALGDLAIASFSLDLQGITVTAWVSAANTVSVRFQNESGGVLDLGSGTLRVRVIKQ